jgi:hypothetical protein
MLPTWSGDLALFTSSTARMEASSRGDRICRMGSVVPPALRAGAGLSSRPHRINDARLLPGQIFVCTKLTCPVRHPRPVKANVLRGATKHPTLRSVSHRENQRSGVGFYCALGAAETRYTRRLRWISLRACVLACLVAS